MAKKMIAVICIPLFLLIALSVPTATIQTVQWMQPGTTVYRISYLTGMLLVTAVVLFFWGRWIFRALKSSRVVQGEKPIR